MPQLTETTRDQNVCARPSTSNSTPSTSVPAWFVRDALANRIGEQRYVACRKRRTQRRDFGVHLGVELAEK